MFSSLLLSFFKQKLLFNEKFFEREIMFDPLTNPLQILLDLFKFLEV